MLTSRFGAARSGAASAAQVSFPGLPDALIALAIAEHRARTLPALRRLHDYYRNPERPAAVAGVNAGAGGRRARWAQECGLPGRITGQGDDARATRDDRRWKPEAVVENDIGWRVQLMVDFMFGKPVQIVSTAPDSGRRAEIERVLDAVWEASGGIALLQDMALLGHVYGHIDLMLRAGEAGGPGFASGRGETALANGSPGPGRAAFPAEWPVRIEVVEPTRGIPILDPSDYRRLAAYVIHFERELNEVQRPGAVASVAGLWRGASPARKRSAFTEIVSASHRRVFEDGVLAQSEDVAWTGGETPVVHIQNTAQPFRYAGLGEVEPLIPLQDELNTRLSDRAARVTLQSFKMYLAKGVEGFERTPVGPGQVWTTENLEASVEEFGGDKASPGEEAHIAEVREALDKTSGVPPLASGVVRAKIGNLTSANALRITLMGVLSRTARKRVTYGRGIAEMSRKVLAALDALGVFATDPGERGVKLVWPDPLPEDVREQAAAAQIKTGLGVPRERVLAELGYSAGDAGVV